MPRVLSMYGSGRSPTNMFFVDRLLSRSGSNLKWKYPSCEPDIEIVAPEQILDCTVDGEWNILNNRNSKFTLRNHELIEKKFKDLV